MDPTGMQGEGFLMGDAVPLAIGALGLSMLGIFSRNALVFAKNWKESENDSRFDPGGEENFNGLWRKPDENQKRKKKRDDIDMDIFK